MPPHLEFRRLALDGFARDGPSSLERTYLERQPCWTIHSTPGLSDQGFAEVDDVCVNQSSPYINEHPIEIVVHTMGAKAAASIAAV